MECQYGSTFGSVVSNLIKFLVKPKASDRFDNTSEALEAAAKVAGGTSKQRSAKFFES